MQLLERDEALAAITGRVTHVDEHGAVVLVSGEAGIGKTTLLRAVVDRLSAGTRLLSGACDDLSVARPLGPFLDMAAQAPRLGDQLAAAPGGAASAILAELRRDSPTVCIIEDAHWADEATIDVLTQLVRRLTGTRLVVLVSFRDDELGSDHPLRRALAAVPGDRALRVSLQPLSLDAARQLAGGSMTDRGVATLHAATSGNPFFLTEALAAGGEETPASVRDAVLTRLARLSSAGRAVAEVVSVFPSRAELTLVERCATDDINVGLSDAEATGLLVVDHRFVAFRHELARRAVEESIPTARRIELNRQVLNALIDADINSSARLAHHAWQVDDADTFLQHAIPAAQDAARRGAHREAGELLHRASQFAGHLPVADHAALLDTLAEEAFHTGQGPRALEASLAAVALRRELGDPYATSSTLRWQARIRWLLRDGTAADAAAEEAVTLVTGLPPSRELAMGLSVRSQLAMLKHRLDAAIAWGNEAITIASELGDLRTLAHAKTNVGTAVAHRDDLEAGIALLEEAVALGRQCHADDEICRALVNLTYTALESYDYPRARAALTRGLSESLDRGMDGYTAYLSATRARLDLYSGDWDAAIQTAQELVSNADVGDTVDQIPALCVLGTIAVRRGDVERGRALLDQAWVLAQQTGELQRIAPIALGRAELAWLSGDLDGVASVTDEAYEMALGLDARGTELGELALWRFRAGAVDAAPAGSATMFALEIGGDPDAAAAEWESLGRPYDRALALMAAGHRDALVTAIEILHALGAAPAARIARERLRALGVGPVPRGPRAATRENRAGLTGRQMDVLRLLAAGLTNPQIAAELVLSPKTVEHHVAAVLAKLGARSRAEAIAQARDMGVLTTETSG